MQISFDIVILGGGPAGSCAALRLLKLGYKVALIESQVFPRFQIGESLSPGVFHLLDFLGGHQVLEESLVCEGIPAQVIWQEKAQIFAERKPSIVVNRGKLDFGMLDLASKHGLRLFQPAKFTGCKKQEDHWLIRFHTPEGNQTVISKFIVDARGIAGAHVNQRITLSPASLATWIHIPSKKMPGEVLIEALPNGWVWGAPVAGDQYRIMLFTDSKTINEKTVAHMLRAACAESQFFRSAGDEVDQCCNCMAPTYLHSEPWIDDYVRVGDSSFAIDPLSSSGVEKGIRTSLQAAVAINSALKADSSLLSKNYYEEMLAGSMANHLTWTANYYSSSWAAQNEFWRQRAEICLPEDDLTSSVITKLHILLTNPVIPNADNAKKRAAIADLDSKLLSLSTAACFEKITCLTGDFLEEKNAIRHPHLNTPLVYVNNIDIASLLSDMSSGLAFTDLLSSWTKHMKQEQAVQIIQHLCAVGVLSAN